MWSVEVSWLAFVRTDETSSTPITTVSRVMHQLKPSEIAGVFDLNGMHGDASKIFYT